MLSLVIPNQQEYVAFANQISRECRGLGTHEAASQHITRRLYEEFQMPGNPEIALARIYRLTPVKVLPADLKALVEPGEQYVMVLTGTYGVANEWRDRRTSQNHRVIPIRKAAVSGLIPMFEDVLVNGMKVDFDLLYATGDVIASTGGLSGVFFVPDVTQAPQIIDQERFVKPYGICSEIGYGGVMAGGEGILSLYTLFIFTRVPVSMETAYAFFETRPSIGTALANTDERTIFAR